jgi:hypothetical protein
MVPSVGYETPADARYALLTAERGLAVLHQRPRTCSMKRSVPSPANVVTEVTKALEQIS